MMWMKTPRGKQAGQSPRWGEKERNRERDSVCVRERERARERSDYWVELESNEDGWVGLTEKKPAQLLVKSWCVKQQEDRTVREGLWPGSHDSSHGDPAKVEETLGGWAHTLAQGGQRRGPLGERPACLSQEAVPFHRGDLEDFDMCARGEALQVVCYQREQADSCSDVLHWYV